MNIVDPAIERFIIGLHGKSPPAFAAMERAGKQDKLPLIDPQVGHLLLLLAKLTGARRVLEIGTCIGYSAAWLALGVGPKGRITSLEVDPARAERARKNLASAGVAGRVDVVVGDARKTLPALAGRFDLIFNDGDKRMYPMVGRAAERLLVRGGLLVSDNALWGGSVAKKGGDADTRAIRSHDERLLRSRAFDSVILPVRDGVLVARRR